MPLSVALKNKWLNRETGKYAICFLIVLGIWLLAHPYSGLVHDSVIYSFQALARLYPVPLRGDLFFAYGSQDDFSLFSPLYAWLIAHAGLENAMRLVVGASQFVWLWAAWRISAALPTAHRFAFLTLIAAIPGAYATVVIGYGEMFVTARIVTEALTLAAIASVLAGRARLGWGLMAAAAVLHPLMAAGGILILLFFWGLKSPRRLAAGAGMLAAAASVLLIYAAHAGRLSVMDPAWFALVRDHSKQAIISDWSWSDKNQLAVHFALLWLGRHFCRQPALKRLFSAALIMGALALAASVAGALFWRCQILLQIQPMRAFWLVKWLAVLAFASLLWRKDVGGWIPLLAASAWLAQNSIGGLLAVGAIFLAGSERRLAPVGRSGWLLLACAAASWIGFQYFLNLTNIVRIRFCTESHTACSPAVVAALRQCWQTCTLFLGTTGAYIFREIWRAGKPSVCDGSRRYSRELTAIAIGLFIVGVSFFYANSEGPQKDFTERGGYDVTAFTARIPRDATVYWADNVVYAWFYLGRKNYYSGSQSAGAMFSRAATMEMKRRAEQVRAIGATDALWTFRGPLPPALPEAAVRRGLFRICRDRSLDFVILKNDFPDLQIAAWRDPQNKRQWWLYDCRRIEKNAATPLKGNR